MKGMKKLLSTLSLTFVLAACSTSGNTKRLDWSEYKNYGQGIEAVSDKFKNYDLNYDKEGFEKAKTAADEAAVNKNLGEFNRQASKALDIFSGIKGKTVVARARYYASAESADKKIYEDLYDTYLGFYPWYYKFLNHVNESSPEIRKSFFEDMTEEEIKQYISDFYYTDESKVLDTEITAIQDSQEERYKKFAKAAGSAKTITAYKTAMNSYISDSLNNFRSVIEKGNRYAELFGFDDYMSYVYSEYYNRNYTCDFVADYAPLIEQYIIPLVDQYERAGSTQVLSNPTLLDNFMNQNFCYEPSFQGDAIDAYMARIGGVMTEAYENFKTNGYYCFTTNSKSLGTAYVTSVSNGEPMIFFSSNYQNASTFVHEFGHYTVAYANKDGHAFPYDIEETHSQANEMLFARYVQEFYKDSPNLDVYQFAAHQSAYEMLTNVILTFATSEVETYVYQNIDKKNSDILEGVNAIWDKYYDINPSIGFFDSLYYWCNPIVSATGYYISYATSGVAAVGAYVQACENFDNARDNYLKLVNYPEDCKDVNKFFEYSGLYSPLEESTFVKLQDVFTL